MGAQTVKSPIKLSDATRPFMRALPNPLQSMKRLVNEHQQDRIMRRLSTPDNGTYAITLSLHRVWDVRHNHARTVVLVKSLLTGRYMLFTEREFKVVVKESLALRPPAQLKPTPNDIPAQLEAALHPAYPLLPAPQQFTPLPAPSHNKHPSQEASPIRRQTVLLRA